MTTLAKVISASVDNNGATENAVWADELDLLVLDCALAVALAIGLEVAKVSYVALAVVWGAVLLAVWVDYGVGRSAFVAGLAEVVCYLQCGPALVHPLVLSPKA